MSGKYKYKSRKITHLRQMYHRGAVSGMGGLGWYSGGVKYRAPYGAYKSQLNQVDERS